MRSASVTAMRSASVTAMLRIVRRALSPLSESERSPALAWRVPEMATVTAAGLALRSCGAAASATVEALLSETVSEQAQATALVTALLQSPASVLHYSLTSVQLRARLARA